MTYGELSYKATRLYTKGKITLDKYMEITKPLNREIEQEPILEKIRAEVEALEEGISSYHNDRPWVFKDEVLQIIDKYKKGSEEL